MHEAKFVIEGKEGEIQEYSKSSPCEQSSVLVCFVSPVIHKSNIVSLGTFLQLAIQYYTVIGLEYFSYK